MPIACCELRFGKCVAVWSTRISAADCSRSAWRVRAEAKAAATGPFLPPIFAIAKEGWYITSKAERDRWAEPKRRAPGGTHGYDARLQSMRGLFIAAGPRIRSGLRVRAFDNIHVYEFMCAVLGLQPAKNDGDPAVTRGMLRSSR